MGMGGNGKPPQREWELPALPWEFIPEGFILARMPMLIVPSLPTTECNLFCPACGSVHTER